MIADNRNDWDVGLCCGQVQIKPAIAFGYYVNQRRRFGISLPATSFGYYFGRLDDRKHSGAGYLLSLSCISDVRTSKLYTQRDRKSKTEGQDERRPEHCKWRCSDVREIAGS